MASFLAQGAEFLPAIAPALGSFAPRLVPEGSRRMAAKRLE